MAVVVYVARNEMGAIRLNELGRPGRRQSVQGNGIRAALYATVRNCKEYKTEDSVGDGVAPAVRKYHVVMLSLLCIVCMWTLIAPTTIAYGLLLRLASRDY